MAELASPRPGTESVRALRFERLLTHLDGVVAGLAIVLIGQAQGGYNPTAWSWSALVFGWLAIMALLLRQTVAVDRLGWLALGSLSAYVAWVAASLLWTRTFTGTMLEVQRGLVYVAALAALLLVTRGRRTGLLVGVVLGSTALAVYALWTRLHPEPGSFDPLAVYRLSRVS